MPEMNEVRVIRIWGIVQGVGMRPLAACLARSLSLRGSVRNAGGMLEITIAGPTAQLDLFWTRLLAEKPEPAVFVRHQIETIGTDALQIDPTAAADFVIETSREGDGLAFPAPDLAICAACEAELDDPEDRRFRHPFISCMHCGPRYSILEHLPYDRETTTMATYPMCPDCAGEYRSDTDRRFHAQTIACPDCGPVLEWVEIAKPGSGTAMTVKASMASLARLPASTTATTRDASSANSFALDRAIEAVRAGCVIAVKATGGYHLVCDARNQEAVLACRGIKQRDQKPFAVLFADPDEIRKYAELNPEELDLLGSQARPVVLLHQRLTIAESDEYSAAPAQAPLADAVSLHSPWLGAMLPSTPIQLIIAEACGPLVMTSANRSDDQLIFRDDDMLSFGREQPGLTGILTHDRPILTGLDDAVVRWIYHPETARQQATVIETDQRRNRPGRVQLIRRARGYVPLAIDIGATIQDTSSSTILALGADLKSTSAWSTSGFAWPTQPAGDLARMDVQQAWRDQQLHLQRLLRVSPDLVCHDLHPAYFSTAYADTLIQETTNLGRLPIQHHHAHIASVIAEHHLQEPVLGIAMDGTGFGTDQTVWGGEFLCCSGTTFERMAQFKSVILPGGDTGMRDAWRSLAGYLEDAGLPNPTWLTGEMGSSEQLSMVRAALRVGINCVPNSSAGRLFDAVCALLDLSAVNHYEGECGSLLEYQAIRASTQALTPWPLAFTISPAGQTGQRGQTGLNDQASQTREYSQTHSDNNLIIDPAPVVRGIYDAMAARQPGQDNVDLIPRLALGFHQAICDATLEVCHRLSFQTGLRTNALSGGVFQNSVLVSMLDLALTQAGFRVYWNEKVPPHDGGICLGQAWLAMLKLFERK